MTSFLSPNIFALGKSNDLLFEVLFSLFTSNGSTKGTLSAFPEAKVTICLLCVGVKSATKYKKKVRSLCGLRFEPCGYLYDGHWRLTWSLTSGLMGLVEVRESWPGHPC